MRYLVMTGVPRRRLYVDPHAGHGDRDASHAACRRSSLVIVAAYVCRHSSISDPTLRRRCSAASWAYLANPLVFALVSVGVGSLLHSNGAAIGVSLGFALGGAIITGVVAHYVSKTLASYLLPVAADIVAQLDGTTTTSRSRVAVRGRRSCGSSPSSAPASWRTLHDEY